MATLQKISEVFKFLTKTKAFDRVLDKVKIVSASPGKVVGEFVVEEQHCNRGETLHGGLTATIIDDLTTCSLLTFEGGRPGATVDLHVSYCSPAKIGDLVTVTAECIKVGNTLGFTMAELTHQDGTVIARGNHTKNLGGSKNMINQLP